MPPRSIPDISVLALQLAHAVPETVTQQLANALVCEEGPLTTAERAHLVAAIAQPGYRAAVDRFMTSWIDYDASVPPLAVAYALMTAVTAVHQQRSESSIQLVWTGPNPEDIPLRRTDQALLEVINAAQQTLLIVTFAAYEVPTIGAALIRAAVRGVDIRIVIESSQASDGKIAYDAIGALGPAIREHATIYVWPHAQRPVDPKGRYGSLHAKCAVADDRIVFVSSANLTAYALTLNMELGVLIRDPHTPRAIAQHFTQLIERGVLLDVAHYV